METTPISLTPEAQEPRNVPFLFTGRADEYFKIWIVNTVLSILTLGLFSPWAKIRARRYIYGHTFLGDRNFDYHANPIQILKGRLIVGFFVLMFYFGGYLSPAIPIAAAAILFALTPWIIVKSLRFNLKNTSFRNLRFGFNENYKGLYQVYIVSGILTLVTFGLYMPIFVLRQTGFLLNNARYGATPFRFREMPGFYGIYIRAAGLQILGSIIVGAVVAGIAFVSNMISPSFASVIGIVAPLVAYAVFAFTGAYIKVHTVNYVTKNTELGEIKFSANLDFFELAKIYVTNFFAIVFTLGLATPWALIRARKYRMDHMYLNAPGGLAIFENFNAGDQGDENATGDAAADFFDLDFGF